MNRWRRIPWFRILVGLLICGLAVVFFTTVRKAWEVQTSDGVSCGFLEGHGADGSYVEFDLEDQAPSEGFFNGNFFINLGQVTPSFSEVQVFNSSGEKRGYAGEETDADFVHLGERTFWMKRKEHITYATESGSHRDFPFDSGTIVLDFEFRPRIEFQTLNLRDFNSSFYIPCDTASMKRLPGGKFRVKFDMRRNPLVRITGIVLIIAATLFVLVIPFSIRWEAMPTSVASFFFSIWSIRSILSPEIKIFPTLLDLILLSLSVLLLFLVGVRAILEYEKQHRGLN